MSISFEHKLGTLFSKFKWITKKIKKFFHLNNKNPNSACVIYEQNYIGTCKENFIEETKQNVEILGEEHSDINKISRHWNTTQPMNLHGTF